MKRYLGLMLVAALSGCVAGVHPGTPQGDAQTVYQAESDYAVALQAAVAYRGLPSCGAGIVICRDDATVAHLQYTARAASDALNTAQSAVQHGVVSVSVVTDAVNTVQAFTALAANLKVK
jgi:hypothetical protein